MNKETVAALEEIIEARETQGRQTEETVPSALTGTNLIEGREELPNRCQRLPNRCQRDECRKSVELVERERGNVVFECRRERHPHRFSVNSSEYTFYEIKFEQLLRAVAEELDDTVDTVELDLPRRATAYTENDLRIVIPITPARFEREVMALYAEALRNGQPTLLLTTKGKLEELLELASLFATGSLVYAAPLSAISENGSHLRTMTQTAMDIQRMEQAFVKERYSDPEDIVHRVNVNPRYVLTELNHMRLLRKTGRLSGGDRLETAVELVFSHLFSTYPGEGGEDASGQSVPDNLFYIPALEAGDRPDSILGVVDAKSADEAKFGREEAKGKHDEYLAVVANTISLFSLRRDFFVPIPLVRMSHLTR